MWSFCWKENEIVVLRKRKYWKDCEEAGENIERAEWVNDNFGFDEFMLGIPVKKGPNN